MASNPVNLHLKKINYVWLQNNARKGNNYWSKEGVLRCSSWNTLLLILLFTSVTDQRALTEELPTSINQKLVVSLLNQQALTFFFLKQLHSRRRGSSVKIAIRRNYLRSISVPEVVLRVQLSSCFILYLDCLQGKNRKINESKLGKQLTKRSQKCLILSSESTRHDNIHETRLRPPT